MVGRGAGLAQAGERRLCRGHRLRPFRLDPDSLARSHGPLRRPRFADAQARTEAGAGRDDAALRLHLCRRGSSGPRCQPHQAGDTTTAFAFAFVVGFLSRRWFVPLLLLAAVVGVSRVAVGAHYPTDVIGGIFVGTFGAYAVRAFFASRGWLFHQAPDGTIAVRPFAATRRLVRSRKPTQAR
ncbi:MAG: phosphatase PAP2 family protein [Hyphomicrobiales bacterium]|nr:MAG: phosphatase PAP2 family protein [Hyphomicrobiales bacterium]